jgi:hypothetical protein
MQANVFSLLSSVSGVALEMPEPLVLLAVGGLLLALGFSGRIRRTRPGRVSRAQPVVDRSAPQATSVLATQQTP